MGARATILVKLSFFHSARPGSVVDKNAASSLLQVDAKASSGGKCYFFIVRALVLRFAKHSRALVEGVCKSYDFGETIVFP